MVAEKRLDAENFYSLNEALSMRAPVPETIQRTAS